MITKEMCIGEVMLRWPSTVEVFKARFGKGCFTCPGSMKEDIEFGAYMHNADIKAVLADLNAAARKDSDK
ncbi:MAG: DUF1858 domain-containing protein [Deltaproteobacteria bacterium]|nr:DUF1858 domain-containing protein [Deltaproteobacteria bacterium]